MAFFFSLTNPYRDSYFVLICALMLLPRAVTVYIVPFSLSDIRRACMCYFSFACCLSLARAVCACGCNSHWICQGKKNHSSVFMPYWSQCYVTNCAIVNVHICVSALSVDIRISSLFGDVVCSMIHTQSEAFGTAVWRNDVSHRYQTIWWSTLLYTKCRKRPTLGAQMNFSKSWFRFAVIFQSNT